MELVNSLSHACVLTLCVDPCLHPGPHLRDRIRMVTVESGKPSQDDTFGTWVAQHAEWVTIGKYGESTLVYVPSQDAFYYASPGCLLSATCPVDTVFVGQFVVDDDSTPRVLVNDLARLRGSSLTDMHARERYACLQQLGGCLGPLCTLQWVGDCSVLKKEFKSGKFKVPHAVHSVVALTGVPGRIRIVE